MFDQDDLNQIGAPRRDNALGIFLVAMSVAAGVFLIIFCS
jgi:hypothetical protein